ncbi:FliM/FliN family flagellar motor switch protein [Escherichia coli]|uniref:FliM/FliN family flagellar motor switch protein n=1 Tax=Escherichia coli TaxID=562 RepID=UPI000B2898B1|nr:FliM/FliN family flagellar motor switch protein [Escherichia coli]EFG9538980.1 hypothetical protein [Escherichia coli]EFK6739348.1 hypothetical protein [Escherichia coli]EGE4019664.1 hypothetical protein [Escherichia coli]
MTDYAISKKSKRSLWIPILVFITLAACASAGYSYWHSHQVAADDKAQQRVVPSPVFVVNTPFHVEIGNLTGEFNICLPFSMIEPLRELLVNPPLENSRNEDQNWRDNLVRQVQHSQLELVANFADISLRLSQILKLKPGDVLPIEKPDRIIAHVDGVPVLTSQYGTLNGQYALRIEHLINPILNSLNEEQPK